VDDFIRRQMGDEGSNMARRKRCCHGENENLLIPTEPVFTIRRVGGRIEVLLSVFIIYFILKTFFILRDEK
jgi:hypothetical protein